MLAALGNAGLLNFVHGNLLSIPDLYVRASQITGRGRIHTGVDWSADYGKLDHDAYFDYIHDHGLLASVFCCQPPVKEINIMFAIVDTQPPLTCTIGNPTGVTLKDFMDQTREWLRQDTTQDDADIVRKQLAADGRNDDEIDRIVQDSQNLAIFLLETVLSPWAEALHWSGSYPVQRLELLRDGHPGNPMPGLTCRLDLYRVTLRKCGQP
ncbi:hypothetical protein IAR55_003340 [Kwoniella newhampshirensis]|uniref:Uncharacterized protein n=1 Tax=Kwoniella newhampshirensis TaxID=1651941 RepID=A0AAW0YNF3_9TREE